MEDGHWLVDQCLAMLMTLTLDYNEIQVINVDKTYDEGRDISNTAARIIQSSQNLLVESIKLSNSEIELTEDKIKTVYEEINSINDLFEPYYNSLN